MAKPKSILAMSAFFDFPFGKIEVSEEVIFYDTIPVSSQLFSERVRSALKRLVPTSLSIQIESSFLPEGVRPSGAVSGYDASIRAFLADLTSILANYITANYVPENKIVR